MISVLSLYESSFKVSSSAIASSKACGRKHDSEPLRFYPGAATRLHSLGSHLLGQSAGLLGRVEDFIVEDGEVEGQAQADGVCWLHVLLADVKSVLVGLLRVLHSVCNAQKQPRHHNPQRDSHQHNSQGVQTHDHVDRDPWELLSRRPFLQCPLKRTV